MDIPFKKPELQDKEIIEKYFKMQNARSCEKSFANVYLWCRFYQVAYAIIEDTLVFHSLSGNGGYSFPAGAKENVKKAIDTLIAYSEEQGETFRLYNVLEEEFACLEELYPDTFKIEYNEDVADYVYDREKLKTLSGKKLHGKRNHINKFKSLHENWAYEGITKENVEECFQMALKWRRENGCEDDDDKTAEMCVTLNALRLIDELGLVGGILRVDGEIVAFTIGEPLNKDTFVVHIEKAYASVQGAYPMINQQFVEHEMEAFRYVNREEDMGAEGLRKAKHSYRPVMMVNKGKVTYIKSNQ